MCGIDPVAYLNTTDTVERAALDGVIQAAVKLRRREQIQVADLTADRLARRLK